MRSLPRVVLAVVLAVAITSCVREVILHQDATGALSEGGFITDAMVNDGSGGSGAPNDGAPSDGGLAMDTPPD